MAPIKAAPWYYGRTVGASYGQNKRLIIAVKNSKEDPRWLDLLKIALQKKPKIPAKMRLFVEPFAGTEEQRLVLLQMIKDLKAK